MFFLRSTALAALALLSLSAAVPVIATTTPPSGVDDPELQNTGVFQFDGLEFQLMHYQPEWRSAAQKQARVQPGYPRRDGQAWETRGTLPIRGSTQPLSFEQKITPVDSQSFRADFHATHPDGVPTRELSLMVTLPLEQMTGRPVVLDGIPYTLPSELGGWPIMRENVAIERTLLLPSQSGTIEVNGVFSLLVQDQRQWNQDAYTVRIRFPLPGTDTQLRQADMGIGLRHIPWNITPVSLRDQANRSFSDGASGNARPGWIGEGPGNDLSAMMPGELKAANVTFDIIDPDSNNARAVIVLGRDSTQTATVPVPDSPAWRNLYLLHAAAWPPASGQPVGTLRVRYKDGTQSTHPVQAGRDVGDWWSPVTRPNGVVGWTGETPNNPVVGLYVSRFGLEEKPIAEVILEGVDQSMWMVAAISGSPDEIIPSVPSVPLEIRPGREWAVYGHSLEIEPGGVFDFSFLSDAPAGKYGPLVATESGHFAFSGRPGEPVRFWGVNLCKGAVYLTDDEAERLAARLAASGYNTVRIHHYDYHLALGTTQSGELNPERLERLDALFAALKRHGLYVNIDLYSLRFNISEEEKAAMGIDEASGNTMYQFKALIPISDEAFGVWANFAKSLLTHRNPHTGLTWAEDPALIGICPVNEDSLEVVLNQAPVVRKRYEDAFAQWWQNPANREKSASNRETGFNLFLHETHAASDARMREFLHSLGVKALLTGSNFHPTQPLAFVREHYDFVDAHQYHDHPTFPEKRWAMPFSFQQRSAVRDAATRHPRNMATRIWGKPFAMTEFNYVRPNRYRAEGGVLMPAYASLQDWNVLYNFEYASNRDSAVSGGMHTFSPFALADDPIGLLADRISAFIFRRGDIDPAKRAIGYAVQSPEAFSSRERDFPTAFSQLGLISRIGSGTGAPDTLLERHGLDAVVTGPSVSGDERRIFQVDNALARRLETAGVLPAGSTNEAGTKFVSDTGQIELRPREGAMKVVTELSELFVLPAEQILRGQRVAVKNGKTFGTVSVISIDGKPIAESERLLVMHLTDSLATGMRFAGQDRRILTARGHAPHLVQAGEAEIRLRLNDSKTWRAWAVDATGKRRQEVPLERQGDEWILSAQTVTKEGTQLAYEIGVKE